MLCFTPLFPIYIGSQSLSFAFDNGDMLLLKCHDLIALLFILKSFLSSQC